MAVKAEYTIKKNTQIANKVYRVWLAGPTDSLKMPGQFVNISLPGFFLRRPFSVSCWQKDELQVVYKVVGGGTSALATLQEGTKLELLCGLGNGFEPKAAEGHSTVLVGGGVGTPPLYGLAQALCAAGNTPTVVLGFATAKDAFFINEFEQLGCKVWLATQDGSAGEKGLVTDILQKIEYTYYYTCGPTAMLRAVYEQSSKRNIQGQLSFEERMGCGFGACMGCSCHTKSGAKRVCVDGPVLSSEEVVFD